MKFCKNHKASYAFVLALILGLGAGAGAGCSAGSPPSLASLPQDQAFSPNYASSLTSLIRWSDTRVTVYLENVPASKQVPVEQALRLWNEALAGKVEFVRVPSPDAHIQIRLVTPESLEGAAGIADVRYGSGSGRLRSVRVSLDQTLDANTMAVICAHELGHGLGILNHSPNPEDLMYYAPRPRFSLSERDRNTARLLYADSRSGILPERGTELDHPGTELRCVCGVE